MPVALKNLVIAAALTAFAAEARATETAKRVPAAPPATAPAAAPAQPKAAEPKPAAPAAEGIAVQPVAKPAPAAPAPKASAPAAPASKPASGSSCDEVKAAIDAKLKAKGVKAFTLDVVGKDEAKGAKIVGSCEGGKKKIAYKRG